MLSLLPRGQYAVAGGVPGATRRPRPSGYTPVMTRTALALAPLTTLLVLLAAGPAGAADDPNPTESSASGFPIALVVLAVVATVFALVVRARNQKKSR